MKLCNLNYLKSVSPKSNKFAVEIITLFMKDTPEAIKLMQIALDNGKFFDVYKNAVKIKPSFQMLGLPSDLFEKLTEVLRLANAITDVPKIKELINAIDKGLIGVYDELGKELYELKN